MEETQWPTIWEAVRSCIAARLSKWTGSIDRRPCPVGIQKMSKEYLTMTDNTMPIEVQAHLHHQYFLGLQLIVSVEEGKEVVGEWIYRLYRYQHEDKFLSSFGK